MVKRMKRIIGMMVAVVMVFSLNASAFAVDRMEVDEETILRAISAVDETFQNEDGCSTEVVCVEASESICGAGEHMNGLLRAISVPKTFYNIALNGIYTGSFSMLRGTMYTNKYFDTADGEYYSRVRCYGEYPRLTYKVGNYCITCGKVISTCDSNYYTPSTTNQNGSWVSFHHTLGSHNDHFVCPFVVNTSGQINGQLYAIGGDIWVNYTDSWDV